MKSSLSIRSRLILMLLLVSGISALILIYLGRHHGKAAMQTAAIKELSSIRSNKVHQIESYFQQQYSTVEVFGQSPTVKTALRNFKNGFQRLSDDRIDADCSRELHAYYEDFLRRLSKNMEVQQDIDLFYPTTTAACYLQFEYIVDSTFEVGNKDKLIDAQDGSFYTKTHREFHPYFKKMQDEFGFYDVFLIDLDQGDIVYSVFKEVDYATNLYSGPYRESNLAQLVRRLRTNRDIGTAVIIDFDIYRPSYGAPAAFIGIPVIDGAQTLGALVVQLPIDRVDEIMTGNQSWKEDGLGESGEAYLVGEDYLMRSVSRFFLEDTTGYRASQKNIGVSEEELDLQYRIGTTILRQRVRTDAVENARRGKREVEIIEDYRNVDVLSAYTPLDIVGLKWVLLAEMDAAEAFASVSDFERKMFIALCLIILGVTFLAMILSAQFLKPVEKLTEAVRRLRAGDYSSRVEIAGGGEFAELGDRFNRMTEDLEQSQTLLATKHEENEQLLLNFIPAHLVKRLRAGEIDIADQYGNVSLIAIDVVGFSALTERTEAITAIKLLNSLMDAFDAVAERHYVEKIRTVGDSYFAACGMFSPRLDHTKRLLDFSRDLRQVVQQFNINHRLQLVLQTAIHTGPVTAGIVGHNKFNFDLIGETVAKTFRIRDLRISNEILVSEEAHGRLLDFYEFEPVSAGSIPIEGTIYRFVNTKNS